MDDNNYSVLKAQVYLSCESQFKVTGHDCGYMTNYDYVSSGKSVANPCYTCVKDACQLIRGIFLKLYFLNVSHITPPPVVHITAGMREGQDETKEMKADVIRIPKGP